jgi:hypothetical protein
MEKIMAIEKQPNSPSVQYTTKENKKANVVAMILFTDIDSKENYILLIQKQDQLQTPGGKVKTIDSENSDSPKRIRTEEETYLHAAIREACEEICNIETDNYKKLEQLLNETKTIYIVNAAERQKLNLRPEDGNYDTRTLSFYLGAKNFEEMRRLLKDPDPNNTDATAAYIVPCKSVANEKNVSLTVEGSKGKCSLENIGIRPTTITILREGMLPKIQEKFLISQSYSRSVSPTHFQPAEEKTIANQQEQCKITPKT